MNSFSFQLNCLITIKIYFHALKWSLLNWMAYIAWKYCRLWCHWYKWEKTEWAEQNEALYSHDWSLQEAAGLEGSARWQACWHDSLCSILSFIQGNSIVFLTNYATSALAHFPDILPSIICPVNCLNHLSWHPQSEESAVQLGYRHSE